MSLDDSDSMNVVIDPLTRDFDVFRTDQVHLVENDEIGKSDLSQLEHIDRLVVAVGKDSFGIDDAGDTVESQEVLVAMAQERHNDPLWIGDTTRFEDDILDRIFPGQELFQGTDQIVADLTANATVGQADGVLLNTFNEGRVVSSQGLDIPVEEFPNHFEEIHVEHSTALQGRMKDGNAYFVGPMARFNLNYDRLPEPIQVAAKAGGLEHPVKNPFRSLLVRALETVYACDEALRIIDAFKKRDPFVEIPLVAGTGHAITEAPRGLLYHRYTIDDQGIIQDAVIIPPTSQNQPTIEEDLFDLVTQNLHLPDAELQHLCEQSIRNYDPCISCATHFLNIKVERNR